MPIRRENQALTLKEETFVAAYLEHQNMADAAMFAYKTKSRDYARMQGFRVLRNDNVRMAIRQGFRDKLRAANLTREWLVARALVIAKGSMRQILNRQDGKLVMKPAEQITDDALDAILSVKITKETTTRTAANEMVPFETVIDEQVTEIKLHPVGQELDKLFKHFGLYFDASDLKIIREEMDRMRQEISQLRKNSNGSSRVSGGNGHAHAES